ncbi:MAG: 50S ribosomal protein L6 [Candidatus Paceibacterota bacterium]
MSKIGNTPIQLPAGIIVTQHEKVVTVKGPKGELSFTLFDGIKVKIETEELIVSRTNNEPQTAAFHGLVRSILSNYVQGVNEGYKKTLKLIGTGYRVSTKGAGLSVTVGYSHPVDIDPVVGIELKTEGNDTIHVMGIDKQLVGQVSANIRAIRPPEPYKGKGIRYVDEVVKTKPGKTSVG